MEVNVISLVGELDELKEFVEQDLVLRIGSICDRSFHI